MPPPLGREGKGTEVAPGVPRSGKLFVYRVKLASGAIVAVKHITRTSEAASLSPTEAVLRRSVWEFDAEVGTLSSIRHVNLVKLLCSVTSEDGTASLLVYEHLWQFSIQGSWRRVAGEDALLRCDESAIRTLVDKARGDAAQAWAWPI